MMSNVRHFSIACLCTAHLVVETYRHVVVRGTLCKFRSQEPSWCAQPGRMMVVLQAHNGDHQSLVHTVSGGLLTPANILPGQVTSAWVIDRLMKVEQGHATVLVVEVGHIARDCAFSS